PWSKPKGDGESRRWQVQRLARVIRRRNACPAGCPCTEFTSTHECCCCRTPPLEQRYQPILAVRSDVKGRKVHVVLLGRQYSALMGSKEVVSATRASMTCG